MAFESNIYWLFLTLIGGLSGFGSGLLGIGGGLVIVPALIYALPHLDVSSAEIPKIAMATSLALIIPTSIASAQAHAARGAIDWPKLGLLAPSIIIGAFAAATLVPALDTRLMVLCFVTFALFASWSNLVGSDRSASSASSGGQQMPTATTALKVAAGGGLAASLGIGGAFFIVPILSRVISMQRAIGTASALALPLSIAGTTGYILADAPQGCANGCMGYIFVPAVAVVGIGAVLAAPLGAWLSHRSQVAVLRRMFAAFLIVSAASLSYKTFYAEVEARGTSTTIEAVVESFQPTTPLPDRKEKPALPQQASPVPAAPTGEPLEPAEPEFFSDRPPGEPGYMHLWEAPSAPGLPPPDTWAKSVQRSSNAPHPAAA